MMPENDTATSRSEEVTAGLLARIAETLLQTYPENATYLGIDRLSQAHLKSSLTDRSGAGIADFSEAVASYLKAVRNTDRSEISGKTRVDLDVVETALDIASSGMAFGFGDVSTLNVNLSHRSTPYVVAQNTGALVEIPEFLDSQHTISDAADIEAYLNRLSCFAQALDGETARILDDGARGIVLPDFLLEQTLRQREGFLRRDPASWQIVDSLEHRTYNVPDRYLKEAADLARARVAPALERQVNALRQVSARARPECGAWTLPEGEAYYEWALRASSTEALKPAEIHATGHDQLRRLQDRMDGLLRKLGRTSGSVGERMAALACDPTNLFPDTADGRADLLRYLEDRLAAVRLKMPAAFSRLVPGNVAIRRISEAIEDGAPDGYAGPGSIDGSVAGIYYINLRNTEIWPRHALPTLTYHEAIPGHIWQGEYANQLSLIRSLLSFNSYSEGWALYAEQMCDELGLYEDDPLGQLGYLQSLAFRACRLVVDTGLHAMRWTRQEAVDWLATANGSPRAQVIGEVDRYCVWPGQACSYKVGHMQITGLRQSAMRDLGSRFDLKSFNTALVGSGSVPYSVLSQVIGAHVAEQHARSVRISTRPFV